MNLLQNRILGFQATAITRPPFFKELHRAQRWNILGAWYRGLSRSVLYPRHWILLIKGESNFIDSDAMWVPPRRMVFAGGGIRAIAHIGALKALQEAKLLHHIRE